MFKIGHGYDFHRFVEGRPLVLGGVTIPHRFGLAGHSDADALLHAVCDAILGALALGDIGQHFPNHDPRFKEIASLRLLEEVVAKARVQGYAITQVDSTVIADEPTLAPHIAKMRERLSMTLKTPLAAVSIKATS